MILRNITDNLPHGGAAWHWLRTTTCVVPFLSFTLLAASPGRAQTVPSFEDLALRVNLDDQIRVEDRSGATIAGRLMRLTRDELAIGTDAGEKRLGNDAVRSPAMVIEGPAEASVASTVRRFARHRPVPAP